MKLRSLKKISSVSVIQWGLLIVIIQYLQGPVSGHGRLVEPPSRSSMWRYGFRNPHNYDDNGLNCGGFQNQWKTNGGRCGVCGDPYQGPRENEAGGKYANGIVVRNYNRGQTIEVKVQITANHNGWFEFRLCDQTSPNRPITQECLDRNVLMLADGSGTRYNIPRDSGWNFEARVYLKLPDHVTCTRCVLQWKWNAGNNWGRDMYSGRGCVGCGSQEQFYGCADIGIGNNNGNKWFTESSQSGGGNTNGNRWFTESSQSGGGFVTQVPTENQWTASTRSHVTVPTRPRTRKVWWPTTSTTTTIPSIDKAITIPNGSRSRCGAVGIWRRVRGMAKWCEINCSRGFCPKSHCMCRI